MQDRPLKRIFFVDALTCLACAALLIGGANLLSEPFRLAPSFLAAAGYLLLPVAALFLWIARTGSRPLGWLGAIGNVAWVIASAAVIPILQPSLLGMLFIAGQAAAVLALACFEYEALKRLARAA